MADELRVTQNAAEAIVQGESEVQVTQNAAEVVATTPEADVPLIVTQNATEPIVLFNPPILQITQNGVDIVIKPMEDEPPPPPETTLENCDLLLEVFNDDRETVRWSAATSFIYSNPFLVMPDRYAEQEIDPATGSATLGTVTCTIVDSPDEPGDQDGGFLTGKLAYQVIADIAGRRARLLRAIGEEDATLEVVIDGVAGTPRMDSSYAAFAFEIRDTREVERKIRCFDGSIESTNALFPYGVTEPYGLNPETGDYLLEAVVPLTATFMQNPGDFPNVSTGSMDLSGIPGSDRTIPLSVFQAMTGQVVEDGPIVFGVPQYQRVRFPNLTVLWRAAGSGDPWSVIDGAHLILDTKAAFLRYNLGVVTTDLGDGLVRLENLAFGDDRIAPSGINPPAFPPDPEAALPAHGQSIDFLVLSGGPASNDNPFHIEGLTAGQFAKNVYDGVYSARDENGQIVPQGIRYDTAALLAMTEPIRLRVTEPITDARDWLEKYIYAPTGWIPALDRFGRISPVSQEPPDDIFGLPLIYDAITEPAPDWDAGDRIVNIVRFIHYRDYKPDDPENAETLDGLAVAKSPNAAGEIHEFQDPVSHNIRLYGTQVLEFDGRAFRAIGDPQGRPVLEGGLSAELGFQLATDRGTILLARYAFGAPVMVVNVRREFTPTLRAGSWVRVWLSWFPDYVTNRRGLICLAQIVALGDLDCVWRRVTMEQVVPLALYDVDDDLREALLTGKTGKILLGKSGQPLTANF